MPEPLLKLLELCLLALVWLFFLRVLRAVWTEVKGPASTAVRPAPSGRRASPVRRRGTPRLVVVEPKDRKGRSYDLRDEQTVGRAAGCQITLDDTYVSQLHARVFKRDGQIFIEDLGSTNGTKVNGAVVTERKLKDGDTVAAGDSTLRFEAN